MRLRLQHTKSGCEQPLFVPSKANPSLRACAFFPMSYGDTEKTQVKENQPLISLINADRKFIKIIESSRIFDLIMSWFFSVITANQRQKMVLIFSVTPYYESQISSFFAQIFHQNKILLRASAVQLVSPVFLRVSVPPWWVLVFGCGSAALCLGDGVLGLVLKLEIRN